MNLSGVLDWKPLFEVYAQSAICAMMWLLNSHFMRKSISPFAFALLLSMSLGFTSLAYSLVSDPSLTTEQCEPLFEEYFADYGYNDGQIAFNSNFFGAGAGADFTYDCEWNRWIGYEHGGWVPGEPWAMENDARLYPFDIAGLVRFDTQTEAQEMYQHVNDLIQESVAALDAASYIDYLLESHGLGMRSLVKVGSMQVDPLGSVNESVDESLYYPLGRCFVALGGRTELRWSDPEFEGYHPTIYDGEFDTSMHSNLHPDFDHGLDTLLTEMDKVSEEFNKSLVLLCGETTINEVDDDPFEAIQHTPVSSIRVLDVSEIQALEQGNVNLDVGDETVEVDQEDFIWVDGSPFSYWITDKVTLEELPNAQSSAPIVQVTDIDFLSTLQENLEQGSEEHVIAPPKTVQSGSSFPVTEEGQMRAFQQEVGTNNFSTMLFSLLFPARLYAVNLEDPFNFDVEDAIREPFTMDVGFKEDAPFEIHLATYANYDDVHMEVRAIYPNVQRPFYTKDIDWGDTPWGELDKDYEVDEEDEVDIHTLEIKLKTGTIRSKDTWLWVSNNEARGYSLVGVKDGTLTLTTTSGEITELTPQNDGTPGVALLLDSNLDAAAPDSSWKLWILGFLVLGFLGILLIGSRIRLKR